MPLIAFAYSAFRSSLSLTPTPTGPSNSASPSTSLALVSAWEHVPPVSLSSSTTSRSLTSVYVLFPFGIPSHFYAPTVVDLPPSLLLSTFLAPHYYISFYPSPQHPKLTYPLPHSSRRKRPSPSPAPTPSSPPSDFPNSKPYGVGSQVGYAFMTRSVKRRRDEEKIVLDWERNINVTYMCIRWILFVVTHNIIDLSSLLTFTYTP